MSVRLDTIPRLTKNFAGGSDDTRRSCSVTGRKGREGGRSGRWGADPGRPRWYRIAGAQRHSCDLAARRGQARPGRARGGAYHRAMLLAVDIGNTNITIGLVPGRRARRDPPGGDARDGATADELELLLDGLLAPRRGALRATSRRSRLLSVVPALTAGLEDDRRRGASGRSSSPRPGPCRSPSGWIGRPRSGADRLVNALAAHRLYGAPAVVVDFGTATTFDCRRGRRRLRRRRDRARPRARPRGARGADREAAPDRAPAPDRAIGRDTVSAIQAGTVLGYQALAAGLLARVRRELADAAGIAPRDVKAILTGGLSAGALGAGARGHRRVDPDLTLEGLAILHAEVAGGEPLELGLG